MVESFSSKRAIFPIKKQRVFLFQVKEISSLSWNELAELLKISNRTLSDWKREKFSMSFEAVKILSKKINKDIPKNIEVKDSFWYVNKGAKNGGFAMFKKYGRVGGDPEYRKKKWREWWESNGKFNTKITMSKSIRKPDFSKNLAEFVGIVLGDGGISLRQVIITLHSEDDKDYGKFVSNLIKKLFNVPVGNSYRKRDSTINYVVSRIELVRFCVDVLGLKVGNKIKHQVNIPDWIKKDKKYAIACVRGLVDTDGCVFTHNYKVNGKVYSYKKLAFTSHSKPLRESVFNILKDSGLNPRLVRDVDVRVDSIKDMNNYFKIFGSHNSKHLMRYLK